MAYADKTKEKANKKAYYLKNSATIKARARKWNIEHPEEVRKHKQKFEDNRKKERFGTSGVN